MNSDTIERDCQSAPVRSSGSCGLASTALMLVLVGAAAVAFGWPTRDGAFLSGDDQRFVVEQVYVARPSLAHAAKLLGMVHGDLYQPAPMLSFQANYALAAAEPDSRFGVSPRAFHLTNIALHAACAMLACMVALLLARSGPVALLTGLMFACHPMAMEPVAWISGRMILMAAFFSLLTMLACLGGRVEGKGAILAGLVWLGALLSKVLPSVPLAAAWLDYRRNGWPGRRRMILYAVLLAAGGVAVCGGLYTTSRFGMIEGTETEATTGLPVRVLLAGSYYLESYIWPSRMAAWSPPPENVVLFSSECAVAALEWAFFGILMLAAWRRERLAFTGLVLFVILLAPFLAAGAVRRMFTADRYMYLPMLGLHLAAAATLMRLHGNLARRIPERAALATGFLLVGLLAVFGVWGTVAWEHAALWKDTVSRDKRIVSVYPDRVEVRIELARAHIFQNQPDAALQAIAAARRRWPNEARLAAEAGEAYRLLRDWPQAAVELEEAARRLPYRSRTLYHYALTLEELGRDEEARSVYGRIIEREGSFLPAVTALARSHRDAGETVEAIRLFEKALEINPRHRDCLFELALLRIRSQSWDSAAMLLRRIVELDAEDSQAWLNLGVALANLGETDEAAAIYDRLIAREPAAIAPRLNRANLLAVAGRLDEAEIDFRAVLASHPDSLSAAVGLHELLQTAGRFGELVELWSDYEADGQAPAEKPAWLAWSHALAGDAEAATIEAETVSRDASVRPFVDWALAYAALKNGELRRFRDALGTPRVFRVVSPAQRDQARVVLAALSALPEELRNTAAGHYALARALLFADDATNARAVAEKIVTMPDASDWVAAAKELSAVLDRAENATGP